MIGSPKTLRRSASSSSMPRPRAIARLSPSPPIPMQRVNAGMPPLRMLTVVCLAPILSSAVGLSGSGVCPSRKALIVATGSTSMQLGVSAAAFRMLSTRSQALLRAATNMTSILPSPLLGGRRIVQSSSTSLTSNGMC